MTILAYRFALDPTPAQERTLRSHAGAARVAFNWGLARVKANLGQRDAEKTYGIVGDGLLHEDGRRLAGLVAVGTARVLSVTVRFERGRWHASFAVETEVSRPAPRLPDAVVGVDLGIKTLAVLSTGDEVPSPLHMSGALRKLRRLSRALSRKQGPDRRTRREPSGRWRRASAALGKARGRVADQRRDGLHQLTARLAAEFGTVVVEDLNVAGMVRNRRLARHVADASFGEFRRQAEYKAAWRGGRDPARPLARRLGTPPRPVRGAGPRPPGRGGRPGVIILMTASLASPAGKRSAG